ncbi:MAG TPA: thioesterase family protein [Deinococcales bacterium]|nr:thioesterase family protein [Deinococcales bacterium]
MKPIPPGYQASLVVTVTPDMTVHFGELGSLHPVYATYQMARHFEEAGRKVLLPHLEEGEEGIGSALTVQHTASALVGMRVTVTATLDRVDGRRLFVDTVATNEIGDEIGRGSTVQVVMPRQRLDEGFARLQARWQQHQEETRG